MKIRPLFWLFLVCAGCAPNAPDEEKLDQEVTSSWSNGAPRAATYYEPGTRNKVAEREFYEDSTTYREWRFESGLRNGVARSYRKNGKPWSLNTYVNDTLDGAYQTWHENGQIYIDGQYRMGRRSGIWKFYSPSGELAREIDFDADSLETR